jgi:hypothetical protein
VEQRVGGLVVYPPAESEDNERLDKVGKHCRV